MSEYQIKSPRTLFPELGEPSAMEVPVQFGTDLALRPQLQIQPLQPMNPIAPEKSLIPALFQIAARAEEIGSIRALRNALAASSTPLHEMMLNAEKVEGILKGFGKKKKSAARRTIARMDKRISAEDGQMA
jgi:hypothetical protein